MPTVESHILLLRLIIFNYYEKGFCPLMNEKISS